MSSQELQQLAELAYKFGPFFFSILFVMFLTRWSYKKYSAAVSQNPPIDPTDKKINRTMFVTYLFVGVALVALSVTWWWFFKPGVYLFIGKIKDLQPQDEIAADIYYLKCQYRGPLSAEDSIGQLRDEEFIIVGTHPFKKGQSFALEFSKNHQRRQKLWIIYEGDTDEPVFELQYDETNNRFFLKSVSEGAAPTEKKNASSFLSFFEARAWASVSESSQKAQAQTGEPKADESLIKVIQDPRSNVGLKLDAIETLNSKTTDKLRADLELPGPEPVALTIFDLTQHSDQELAYKAKLLADKADVDGYLIQELSSSTRQRREEAERVLLRISRTHALNILKRVDVNQHDDVRQTALQVRSGANTRILKPTASSDGDRYYIKASWNPENTKTVECLTRLFNSELITKRSLAEEMTLMRGKNQRFVFWYSKDWSLGIAEEVKKCGGQAEFVLAY